MLLLVVAVDAATAVVAVCASRVSFVLILGVNFLDFAPERVNCCLLVV